MKQFVLLLFAGALFAVITAFVDDGDPWDIPAKYQSMENTSDPTDKECLSFGKSLYNKHCKSCHGSEGFGDGKKADEIDTEMPDITTDAYKEQAPGVKYYQSFIGREDMPNFEKKIPSEEDRWCIITYMDQF